MIEAVGLMLVPTRIAVRKARQGDFPTMQKAILASYRDLAAGRLFESSGDFESDTAPLAREEADGWR